MATIMNGGPKAWCTLLDTKKAELEMPDEVLGDDVRAPSLDWGNLYEPRAIANYELIHGIDVEKPEFVQHPSIVYVGCTPDFLTDDVVGEVKCPYNEEVHAMTVVHGTGAESYKPQIQTEIWCTGKDGAHFLSYDPRYKDPDRQLIVIDVPRDDLYLERMAELCEKFYTYLTTDTRPDLGFTTEIPKLF